MQNIDNFLKQYNYTKKDLIEKIQFIIEFSKKLQPEYQEKIRNAQVAYDWLLSELFPFSGHKKPKPTKKQRKDAIDVTNDIFQHTETNEHIKETAKKIAAEAKLLIDYQFGE